MTNNLYRRAVLDARLQRTFGTVLRSAGPGFRALTSVVMVFTSLLLVFLFFGSYTARERASGVVVTSQANLNVYPNEAGVVGELFVAEGEHVGAGQRLLEIRRNLSSPDGTNSGAEILAEYRMQSDELARQHELEETALTTERQQYVEHARNLQRELSIHKRSLGDAERRYELANDAFSRAGTLSDRGLVSAASLAQSEQTMLQAAQDVTNARLQIERTGAQLRELRLRNESRDSQWQVRAAELRREASQLRALLLDARMRSGEIVSAPVEGEVSSLTARVGQRVTPADALLKLVPSPAEYFADLYASARVAASTQTGARVRLRYHAYPYQRFGTDQGTIVSISQAPVGAGGRTPEQSAQPVWLIRVALGADTTAPRPRRFALRPGMTLEADVLLERRRLVDWLLRPLIRQAGGA